MAAPRQMTANTLNAVKGWPNPSALDYSAKIDAGALAIVDPILAGSVVHLNASGRYELGVGTLTVMPLFLFNNSDDPDVTNDGGDPATDIGAFVPVNPGPGGGNAMALVATGAYELVSTSFVDGVYEPNDHLTSAIAGADAGKLDVGTLWTDTICGIVSQGVVDNGYRAQAVAFWPLYLPPSVQ